MPRACFPLVSPKDVGCGGTSRGITCCSTTMSSCPPAACAMPCARSRTRCFLAARRSCSGVKLWRSPDRGGTARLSQEQGRVVAQPLERGGHLIRRDKGTHVEARRGGDFPPDEREAKLRNLPGLRHADHRRGKRKAPDDISRVVEAQVDTAKLRHHRTGKREQSYIAPNQKHGEREAGKQR